MSYREKVIKGLEYCKYPSKAKCDNCPYWNHGCTSSLAIDALALLQEQEIGHWVVLENCSNAGVYCSECNNKIFDHYPIKKKQSYFCPHCGTRMEGEIERL